MTCQECETKLGLGEDASEHLASCEECRWLAGELRLNSVALREMRIRPVMRWAWAAAVAAGILMAIGVWKIHAPARQLAVAEKGDGPLSPLPVRTSSDHDLRLGQSGLSPFSAHSLKKKRTPHVEPLRVKMFTSDPDVVIYWIVDKKEGFE